MKKNQQGAALVEFALVSIVFFTLLLGIVEFARITFIYNTLTEATRKGARLAAVCSVSSDSIDKVRNVTIFNDINDSGASTAFNLAQNNVEVLYFKSDLSTTVSPGLPDGSAEYDDIEFVRVSIIGFNHTMLIPFFSDTIFKEWAFMTILPSESLGRTSPTNPPVRGCDFPS